MPRRPRTCRTSRYALDGDLLAFLATGLDFTGCPFGYLEKSPRTIDAWNHLRAEVLLAHIADRPCTRPWAWWAFEDHEPRLCVSGIRHEKPRDDDPALDYGCASPYAGADVRDLRFESQAHYLRRFGLLLKAEEDHLRLNPDLLEPVEGSLTHWR